jgi:hypothetical protein
MSSFKTIQYGFQANYIDKELIDQTLLNYIQHFNDLSPVKNYTNINKPLLGSEIYNGEKQNFLFVVGDNDFVLTINNSTFTVREMVLIQRANKFDFSVKQVSGSPCDLNIHVLHGVLGDEDDKENN